MKSGLALALVLGLLGVAHQARADAYDAALTRAVAAKEAALDVNEPARWLEALRLFQEADDIKSSAETKYELGFAAVKLRQYDLAVESYAAAIELGLGAAAHSRATQFVAEHARDMAKLNVTGPAGTELYIADILRGRLPLDEPLVIFSGTVDVEARNAGEKTRHSVRVEAGTAETLHIDAKSPSASAAPPAEPDGAPESRASEPDRMASPSNAPWILVAAGGGLAVLGAVMVPVANGGIDAARSELEPLCGVPDGPDTCLHAEPGQREAAQDQVNRIASWKAARIGAFVTAGAGAATLVTGIVMLASRPPSRPNQAALGRSIAVASPAFEASSDRVGVTLRGTFEFL